MEVNKLSAYRWYWDGKLILVNIDGAVSVGTTRSGGLRTVSSRGHRTDLDRQVARLTSSSTAATWMSVWVSTPPMTTRSVFAMLLSAFLTPLPALGSMNR